MILLIKMHFEKIKKLDLIQGLIPYLVESKFLTLDKEQFLTSFSKTLNFCLRFCCCNYANCKKEIKSPFLKYATQANF